MTLTFSSLLRDLKSNIDYNRQVLEISLRGSPVRAYQKINEITQSVGFRYRLNLQLHFPDQKKIFLVDSYGTENIGIVFDKHRKRFPIDRQTIKSKAIEMINPATADDAYMYEGKEGVRVNLENGRVEILPGSIHLWCSVNNDVRIREFVDWLFERVYYVDDLL